jgi:hypothetical protein
MVAGDRFTRSFPYADHIPKRVVGRESRVLEAIDLKKKIF